MPGIAGAHDAARPASAVTARPEAGVGVTTGSALDRYTLAAYDGRMRIVVTVALLVALSGCKTKSRSAEPEPNKNPYREVMPEKVKQKVEDAQKREEQRDDKLLDNAK